MIELLHDAWAIARPILFVLGAWTMIGTAGMCVVILFALAHHEEQAEDTSDVLTGLHQSAARDMVQEGYQVHTEQIAAEIHRREAEGEVWVPDDREHASVHLKVPRN